MKPKQNFIEAAIKSGAMDRINQLLSANQVLMGVSSRLTDEASELLQKYNLLMGPLKKRSNEVVKAFDMYFTEFGTMITEKGKIMDMHHDIDDFELVFKKWAKILTEKEKERLPKTILRGVTKAAKTNAGRSSCRNCPVYKKYGHCLSEEVLQACRDNYIKGFKKGVKFRLNKQ